MLEKYETDIRKGRIKNIEIFDYVRTRTYMYTHVHTCTRTCVHVYVSTCTQYAKDSNKKIGKEISLKSKIWGDFENDEEKKKKKIRKKERI